MVLYYVSLDIGLILAVMSLLERLTRCKEVVLIDQDILTEVSLGR
jgi:hypothetical protein